MNRQIKILCTVLMAGGLMASGCKNGSGSAFRSPAPSAMATDDETSSRNGGDGPDATTEPGEGGTGGSGTSEGVVLDGTIRTLERGNQTDRVLVGPDEILAIDEVSWAQIYALHAINAPLPEVDFDREVVVGAFLGDRSVNPDARSVKVVRVESQTDTGDIAAVIRYEAKRQFTHGTFGKFGDPDNRYEFVAAAARSTTGRLQVTRELEIPFAALDQGPDSTFGRSDPGFTGAVVALRSQQELDTFLAAHGKALTVAGLIPTFVDPLDFSRQMVVAAVSEPSVDSVAIQRIVRDEASQELRVLLETSSDPAQSSSTGLAYALVRTNQASGTIRIEQSEELATRVLAAGNLDAGQRRLQVFLARDRERMEAFWRANIGTPVPEVDFDKKQLLLVVGANDQPVQVRSVVRAEHDEVIVDLRVDVLDQILQNFITDPANFVALEMDRTTGAITRRVESFSIF